MQVISTDKFIKSIKKPTDSNAIIIKDKAPIVSGAPGALYLKVGKNKSTWNLSYGVNGKIRGSKDQFQLVMSKHILLTGDSGSMSNTGKSYTIPINSKTLPVVTHPAVQFFTVYQ